MIRILGLSFKAQMDYPESQQNARQPSHFDLCQGHNRIVFLQKSVQFYIFIYDKLEMLDHLHIWNERSMDFLLELCFSTGGFGY